MYSGKVVHVGKTFIFLKPDADPSQKLFASNRDCVPAALSRNVRVTYTLGQSKRGPVAKTVRLEYATEVLRENFRNATAPARSVPLAESLLAKESARPIYPAALAELSSDAVKRDVEGTKRL